MIWKKRYQRRIKQMCISEQTLEMPTPKTFDVKMPFALLTNFSVAESNTCCLKVGSSLVFGVYFDRLQRTISKL